MSAIMVAHGVFPCDRDQPIVLSDELLRDTVLSIEQILNARASQCPVLFFFF